jgi:hypothetical protein
LVTCSQQLFGGVRDSQWSFFAGNYQEYEVDKRKRLGKGAPASAALQAATAV